MGAKKNKKNRHTQQTTLELSSYPFLNQHDHFTEKKHIKYNDI